MRGAKTVCFHSTGLGGGEGLIFEFEQSRESRLKAWVGAYTPDIMEVATSHGTCLIRQSVRGGRGRD